MYTREYLDNQVLNYFKSLGCHKDVGREFLKGNVYYTEQGSICGLYDLTPSMVEIQNRIETEGRSRVVHVIRGAYNIGGDIHKMDSYIIQSLSRENFGQIICNANDLNSILSYGFCVFAYVHNISYEWDSEYGYIYTKGKHGGIIRVY